MKSNLFALLFADELPAASSGSAVGILLFLIALIIVAGVMAVSAKKLAWQSAALTWFLWLCVGLLMQPWKLFTNQSSFGPVDDYWAPIWKIAAIVWVVSLLLCLVLLIAIYQGKKSSRRRRRRSSSSGSSNSGSSRRSRREGESRSREGEKRSGESEGSRRESDNSPAKEEDEYEEYDDDSYEV